MQTNSHNAYIELKVNRDLGGIITTYFDFLKQNIKKFTNIFLSYNGIFLVGLLIVSYLLVTGFVGMIASDNNSGFGTSGDGLEAYSVYFIAGGILFFIIFILIAVLNYSLAGSYMIKYEEEKGMNFEKKQVWSFVKEHLGEIVLFVMLLILIYIAMTIVNFVFLIIPIVGFIAQYIIQFFVTAWIGVSFFILLQENKGVTEAYGAGWNLVTKDFWKSVGVNFILGLLNGVLLMVVLIIPGILVGLYSFHIVENDVDAGASIIPTIVYTLALCSFLIVLVYTQCLTQFVNGILYYALHEKTYNTNTRSKIDEIGGLGE
jgi:uncharacterized protein involved in cysteine biosynthesis